MQKSQDRTPSSKIQPLKPITSPYLKILPHRFTLASIQSERLLSLQAAIKTAETSETWAKTYFVSILCIEIFTVFHK